MNDSTTASPPPDKRRDIAVSMVAEHEDDIDKKMNSESTFKTLVENGRLLLSLVMDYVRGNYREVPYWVIGAAALSLIYVLSPIDAIPDVIPILGLLDDATVLGVCLKLVDTELARYKEWKARQAAAK